MFITKFHCNIYSYIQLNACSIMHAKLYTRAHCDHTFQGLVKTLGAALDSVDVRKYLRKYHINKVKVGQEMQIV